MPRRQRRFDGLELFCVADEDDFAWAFSAVRSARSSWRVPIMPASSMTRMSRRSKDRGRVPRRARSSRGAGLDAGGHLEILGGDTGERGAFDGIAFGFPDGAHGGEVVLLPEPATPGGIFKSPMPCHVFDGALLLGLS